MTALDYRDGVRDGAHGVVAYMQGWLSNAGLDAKESVRVLRALDDAQTEAERHVS